MLLNSLISTVVSSESSSTVSDEAALSDIDTISDEQQNDFDARNADTFFSNDTDASPDHVLGMGLLEEPPLDEFHLFDSNTNLWTLGDSRLPAGHSPFDSVPGMIASPEDVQTLYFMFDSSPMSVSCFA